MAEIEIGPLSDRLSDDDIAELSKQMEKLGAPQLPRADESQATSVADGVDEDALVEFLDRLDVHDLAAEIYLPVEFEGSAEVAGMRVASAAMLLDVLEEVKEELALDEDEEVDEEDEAFDEDRRAIEVELRKVWKYFFDGATSAVERKLPLHIRS